jgi:subfamily B ATP-binding cassette protein MsbA
MQFGTLTHGDSQLARLGRIFVVFREMLGRRVYVLMALSPVATLSEGFGIALLLPLFGAIDRQGSPSKSAVGAAGGFLGWLPLPTSVVPLLLLIGFAFLLKAVLKFAAEALKVYLEATLIQKLRVSMFESYTNLSYRAFASRNTGHYVNVLGGQVNRFVRAFGAVLTTLMQFLASVVYLVMVWVANWKFACIAILGGGLFISCMQTLTGYVRRLSRETSAEQSNLNTQIVQVIHALKYLMATGQAPVLSQRIVASCGRVFGFQLRTGIARSFTVSAREPLSVALVLLLIGVHVQFLGQPLGAILVALLLLDRATKALLGGQAGWQQTAELMGSVEIVQDELRQGVDSAEVRGTQGVGDFQGSVRFEGVSFSYEGKAGDVLDVADLDFAANQTVALVGRSGAGKSTVADLLTMLLRPTAGRILIDGVDANLIDPRTWRRQLGYVCQETVVFDETIAGNICLSEDGYLKDPECRKRVHEAAKLAFADEFIVAMPEGYNTVVGDRGVRLSGGQRQRLFIARELYKRPAMLILDEATSALDGESEAAIQASIDALRGQMAVVVIAHRLATIKNSDYVYVLGNGRIVEHGSYAELHRDTSSHLRRMIELQSL